MQIALVGFSKSGKTSVFNAITGAKADVSAFATGKAKVNRAVIQVPDSRLDQLCQIFESKKLVHATIDFFDPAGIRKDQAGTGTSLGDEMINTITTADALCLVIRAFEDASGVDCDPVADFGAIWLELILSDLAKVDNRLGRVEGQAQRVSGKDRQSLEQEAGLLKKLKVALEEEQPILGLNLDAEEEKQLRSFQFLTAKPLLVVVNTAEGDDGAEVLEEIQRQAAEYLKIEAGTSHPAMPAAMALCGETEMEISQLEPEERTAFLEEYGIVEPGTSRMIRMAYEALGLISFFTVGPSEAHAWTIPAGSTAVEAAGAIHSDLQRGFIRAQVVQWQDLLADGSMAEAKKNAHLRTEGKDYIVEDGEVIEVMFSV